MVKIAVASTNPVKITAARQGFQAMFPDQTFIVTGLAVPSGVSHQPLSEAETLTGALNRAHSISQLKPRADFWVGIEGGVEDAGSHLRSCAWIVVKSPAGQIGQGRTGSFYLPPQVSDLIRQGKELGEADDIVFGMTNSKQQNGAIGILTGNLLTRTSFYIPAVILALIPFKNPHLYPAI